MAKISKINLHSVLSNKSLWAALFGGGLLTLAYSPFEFWPIAFIAIALGFFATEQPSFKLRFRYGWLFGFSWFGFGISWVHVSIAEFGGLPLIFSVLLMALLCGYLAIYPALAFALGGQLGRTALSRAFATAATFIVFEWLRGTLLTGFPWLSFGYTQTDSPLNVLAPWIGEMGLTFVCVLIAGLLFATWKSKHITVAAISVVALTLALGFATYTSHTTHSDKVVRTLLVQGNIQQSLKWEPEHFWPTMQLYRDMTRVKWHDADLVVWPEAAIPEIEENAIPYLEYIDKAAAFNQTAVITGIPDYQFDTGNVFNTLIVLGKREHDDTIGRYVYLSKNRYQKHQLLPIGEFVPFEDWLRPIAPLFNLVMSSFTRGEAVQPNLKANGLNVLPAICYEIAFAELVRGNFTEQSDLLFTVSNDAWFGDSHGPHQHMQIARMRALELQRPLIRVTNNGITGVYDPITHQQTVLPQFVTDSLITPVKLIHGYSFFSQYGALPTWLVSALLLLYFAITRLINPIRSQFERDFL
jgi:apolipoprotein N-acyltransferase